YQSICVDGARFTHSLKVVIAAIVLHSLIRLGKKLTPDQSCLAIDVVTASIMLIYPSAWMQILIILCAGMLGIKLFKHKAESNVKPFSVNISKKAGITSLSFLVLFLVTLPIITNLTHN